MNDIIKTKKDLKFYIENDMKRYPKITLERKFHHCPEYIYQQYLKILRKTEFHYNNKEYFIHRLLYNFYLRKKNIFSEKLNIFIPLNTCGYGLYICHNNIYIGGETKIGNNCAFYGQNNVGILLNSDSQQGPVIGNHVLFGAGSKVIGNITIGNTTIIGANAVVNKSFPDSCQSLVGVPAKSIKNNQWFNRAGNLNLKNI